MSSAESKETGEKGNRLRSLAQRASIVPAGMSYLKEKASEFLGGRPSDKDDEKTYEPDKIYKSLTFAYSAKPTVPAEYNALWAFAGAALSACQLTVEDKAYLQNKYTSTLSRHFTNSDADKYKVVSEDYYPKCDAVWQVVYGNRALNTASKNAVESLRALNTDLDSYIFGPRKQWTSSTSHE